MRRGHFRDGPVVGINVLEFTDANFDDLVIRASQPVLVDFATAWCPPCKALAPVIDELSDEYQGTARIGKLDTDSNQGVSAQFSVSAIPTLIFFDRGRVIRKLFGLQAKKDLKVVLDELVASHSQSLRE
jgi:thioredoxin 1